MTTALTLRREYLAMHRRMILGRALAGTMVGLVPIPVLDDWLYGTVIGGAYRRIAVAHHVDIDDDAARNLVFGKTAAPGWADAAATTIAFRIATQTWKRVLLALTAVRRARAASRQFAAMTLFDHYCARRHVGLGLDPDRALELRDVIGKVIDETPGGLSLQPFRRGVLAAARATAKAPLELVDIVSGGGLRRLLDRGRGEIAEAEVVEEVEAALDRQLADQEGFLAKAVASVEQQLSAEVNPYVDALIERFDERWR